MPCCVLCGVGVSRISCEDYHFVSKYSFPPKFADNELSEVADPARYPKNTPKELLQDLSGIYFQRLESIPINRFIGRLVQWSNLKVNLRIETE